MKGFLSIIIISMIVISQNVFAHELALPKGKVIMTIKGDLEHYNIEDTAQFDLEMLLQLKQTTISTDTPWTTGTNKFQGPSIKDLLTEVGAEGENVIATALNGYKITIPFTDIETYPVTLALKLNDEILSVRKKGPSWVIYPWNEYKLLKTNVYFTRSIWQLKSLEVTK